MGGGGLRKEKKKREEMKPGSRGASTSPFGLARPTPRTGWKGRWGGRRHPWRDPFQSRKGSDQVGYFHKYIRTKMSALMYNQNMTWVNGTIT